MGGGGVSQSMGGARPARGDGNGVIGKIGRARGARSGRGDPASGRPDGTRPRGGSPPPRRRRGRRAPSSEERAEAWAPVAPQRSRRQSPSIIRRGINPTKKTSRAGG